MKTLILLVVMLGAGFAGWTMWRRSRQRKHDPVEYFSGWDGRTSDSPDRPDYEG